MSSKTFIASRAEMEQILRAETVGYLGLSAGGLPYVVPLNYAYIDGKILFHCTFSGKKLDMLRANPQVCFTVGRQAGPVERHPQGAGCHAAFDSVICYGTARIIEDLQERQQVLNVFCHALLPDAEEITREDALRCYAVEITISEMTGRQEREKECKYWQYRFEYD